VDFAGIEVEIDALDGMYAAIDLATARDVLTRPKLVRTSIAFVSLKATGSNRSLGQSFWLDLENFGGIWSTRSAALSINQDLRCA
jgi:hypothetical protein